MKKTIKLFWIVSLLTIITFDVISCRKNKKEENGFSQTEADFAVELTQDGKKGENGFSQTEADFTVKLTQDGEGVLIIRYTGTATQVRIPATIQGMSVREIGEQAFAGWGEVGRNIRPLYGRNTVSITSVVIPNGVTVIGAGAFGSQQQLTSITIPNTVTIIGEDAFNDCIALASVTIPNSVTRIGRQAFANCTNLRTITIPNSVTSIEDRVFLGSGLQSITWSSSATKIQTKDGYGHVGMFSGCRNLQTVIIPEGVTEIGDYTFRECTALQSITLPSTIEKIGKCAFWRCSALTTVVIPDSVGNIEFAGRMMDSSFFECSKLTLASQAALKRRGYSGEF